MLLLEQTLTRKEVITIKTREGCFKNLFDSYN